MSGDLGLGSDVQLSCLLLLYLPRRGLIEVGTRQVMLLMTSSVLSHSQVWSPDNKSKVTEFHVSKQGKENLNLDVFSLILHDKLCLLRQITI